MIYLNGAEFIVIDECLHWRELVTGLGRALDSFRRHWRLCPLAIADWPGNRLLDWHPRCPWCKGRHVVVVMSPALVILLQQFPRDAIQEFLGEDAEEGPGEVRFSEMVWVSYGPWDGICCSNFARNSRERRSSAQRSSPTTAFIAWASLPMAYFAYNWLLTSA